MFTRIAFLSSAVFWLTMNYLLWRSEFGGPNHGGNVVPTEVVWRKILTSPDNSPLDILHHGKKSGYALWTVAGRNGADSADVPIDGPPPIGQPEAPMGYRLDLGGYVAPDGTSGRVDFGRISFDVNLKLATNRAWQRLDLRISLGRSALSVHSLASEQKVRLRTEDDGERTERVLTFAELQDPRSLAEAFAVPLPPGLLGIPDLSTNVPGDILSAQEFVWEARSEWINVGHTTARAYRLQTKLLDRWPIVIVVSPVGEILRVELPDGWVLANDQTGGY